MFKVGNSMEIEGNNKILPFGKGVYLVVIN